MSAFRVPDFMTAMGFHLPKASAFREPSDSLPLSTALPSPSVDLLVLVEVLLCIRLCPAKYNAKSSKGTVVEHCSLQNKD